MDLKKLNQTESRDLNPSLRLDSLVRDIASKYNLSPEQVRAVIKELKAKLLHMDGV